MKIKFLKPFRLYNPIGDCMMITEGAIENMEKEDYAQWLIDSGFAEEFNESGWWKLKYGERYYYLGSDGCVYHNQWENDSFDKARLKFGLIFKTERATERYRDYQIAVATVRQDEGFMKISRKNDCSSHGYGILRYYLNGSVISEEIDDAVCAGEFYFDTAEHAKASLEKHPDEWKTILDYDWSKGEDEEEDED